MAATTQMLEIENANAQAELANRRRLHAATMKRASAGRISAKAATRSLVKLNAAAYRATAANMALRVRLADESLARCAAQYASKGGS